MTARRRLLAALRALLVLAILAVILDTLAVAPYPLLLLPVLAAVWLVVVVAWHNLDSRP